MKIWGNGKQFTQIPDTLTEDKDGMKERVMF